MEAPTSFTISPNVPSCLSLSPSEFLASRPHIKHLLAGALVFRQDPGSTTPQLQTLLVRRAATDSYAHKWEKPGGSASSSDLTVLSCVVRELWEETGLHATYIRCPVGLSMMSESTLHGWGVDPNVEQAQLHVDDEAQTVSFWESGRRWGVVTMIVDVEENLVEDGVDGKEIVKIRPEEHEEWMWVTEEQVRCGKDRDGNRMEYIGEAVWRIVLEGFRLKRELDTTSS